MFEAMTTAHEARVRCVWRLHVTVFDRLLGDDGRSVFELRGHRLRVRGWVATDGEY